MPQRKAKKKAGNTRGFATISTPSKKELATDQTLTQSGTDVHDTVAGLPAVHELNTFDDKRDDAEEVLLDESAQIIEGGTKLFNRLTSEIEVDKRARKSCIQITLPEAIVEKTLCLWQREHKPRFQNLTKDESLRQLFATELLLRANGLADDAIQEVLLHVEDLSKADRSLQYLARNTLQDIDYETKSRIVFPNEHAQQQTVTQESTPQSFNKVSRLSELLSDEEDQVDIERNPNELFIDTQLELLVARMRLKAEPKLLDRVSRLEKRCRVIENQLAFDRSSSAMKVQEAIKGGYLERAAASLRDEQAAQRKVMDDEKVPNSSLDSEISSSSIVQSQLTSSASEEQDESESESESDSEILLSSSMFSSTENLAPVPDTSRSCSMKDKFPLKLPKTSQNISPIKLLQTFLKRVDKQARLDFDEHEITLTLRFSSAKYARQGIVIKDTRYDFPDHETLRNFLSLKALFSVRELGAEKAVTRFSGSFRVAWEMLELEERDLQKGIVAKKVENVRQIYQQRLTKHSGTDNQQYLESTTHTLLTKANRVPINDVVFENIQRIWHELQDSAAYRNMLQYRSTLPIANFRAALLHAIESNQVVILCGETGCGKSTQLPSFILENQLSHNSPCRIYVTEPRRISAISLATRVSAELGESRKAITNGQSLLGFSIRLDSQVSDMSRLIYATTGIVLRMLEEDKGLDTITHLIIDEVHERSIESDFLLIIVKRLLRVRRDLRVILMSATLQADRFNDYFGGHCCVFNVPGRTFPVEQYFLEDAVEKAGYICDENGPYVRRGNLMNQSAEWELPEEVEDECVFDEDLITYSEQTKRTVTLLDPYKINYDLICILLEQLEIFADRSVTQAILIFLPGLGEIRRLLEILQAHKSFGDYRKWVIYALHSSIASEKQQAAFDMPPRGVRKIVIATNIAETGITIPDITCVIDSGKHKESRFDARRQLSKLVEIFIAKANARQRMGRAGRVQPGICFHLFSRARYERMPEYQLPEFQRLNLDQLALRVKTVAMGGIEEILLEALDAPTPENVKRSVASLIQVGAIDEAQNLTSLGKHLAKLPVDATLGKLILYGIRYSCLDPCVVIAAVLSSKSPFESPIGQEREASTAKQAFVRNESDFMTMWTAYEKWKTVCQDRPQHEQKFCRTSFLSLKGLAAIEELRLQYLKILIDSGLLRMGEQEARTIQKSRFSSSRDGFVTLPSYLGINNQKASFIEGCLAAAFYPNLINVEDGFKTIAKGQVVTLHSSSVNRHAQKFSKRWLVFYSLLKTKSATSAHDTGIVDDYMVALFCGSTTEFRPYSGTISIDHNRTRFVTRNLRTLVALSVLREALDQQFAAFLDGAAVTDAWLQILEEVVEAYEASGKQKLR